MAIDTYQFNLTMFLFYNGRLVKKDWRNATEETIVRENECYYASKAADLMPESLLQSIQTALL